MRGSGEAPSGVDVYDLDTGEQVELSGELYDWGWSSGSTPFRVTSQRLELCDPISGECATENGPRIGKDLRLGGNTYES